MQVFVVILVVIVAALVDAFFLLFVLFSSKPCNLYSRYCNCSMNEHIIHIIHSLFFVPLSFALFPLHPPFIIICEPLLRVKEVEH